MNADGLYSDGGCVGRNPSPLGMTWAWCLVEGGALAEWDAGLLEPADVGLSQCTNNLAELYAAVRALEARPGVVLHTDSEVTRRRLTAQGTAPYVGVPKWLLGRVGRLLPLRPRTVLVAGHPTRAELAAGFRRRNGLPTSRWNVFCDRKCCEQAKAFKP